MMPITRDFMTERQVYAAIAIALLAGAIAGGVYGYFWYTKSKEQGAYQDLAISIDGYVKALGSAQSQENWTDVIRAFEVGAQRHQGSKMHPYFLIYHADALAQQGKIKEAALLMDKALSEIDRKNSLYTTFAVKRALLKIDSEDAALEKQGREELESLSKDSANPFQDMARYYSGLDAEQRGDAVQAERFFREIVAHGQERSYWQQLAQSKLKAIA